MTFADTKAMSDALYSVLRDIERLEQEAYERGYLAGASKDSLEGRWANTTQDEWDAIAEEGKGHEPPNAREQDLDLVRRWQLWRETFTSDDLYLKKIYKVTYDDFARIEAGEATVEDIIAEKEAKK